MDKFFVVFGKIVLVLLVGGLLVGAGVYVGKKNSGSLQLTPSPSLEQKSSTQTANQGSVIVSPTQVPATIFTAGTTGLVFKQYTVAVLPGWAPVVKVHESNIDQVVISKNDYSLEIYQAPFGGGVCLYPGDPSINAPSEQFINYVAFSGKHGEQYRRGQRKDVTQASGNYSVCVKADTFGDITPFGKINYTTPANPDALTLSEMDEMVASIEVK